jgi:hypothetical protein
VSRARELRLTPNGRAVRRGANQLQRDSGSWDHLSPNIENAMHARNATLEISPLLVDRSGEQEIANGVPACCARLSWESKAQKIGCGGLCVRESDKAVPQVAHGWNPELLAQHP